MNEQAKGHGHVTPNANGDKARCGGPKICKVCMAELAALKAQPAGAARDAERESGVSDWFLSRTRDRQAVLIEDKWLLADAAFKAGQARAQLAAPSSEYLTEAVKTLDNLSRRSDARQQRIDQLAAPAGVREWVDVASRQPEHNEWVIVRWNGQFKVVQFDSKHPYSPAIVDRIAGKYWNFSEWSSVEAAAPFSAPASDVVQEKDVHTEHCCKVHGCKYGDDDCTVAYGEKTQSHPCEACIDQLATSEVVQVPRPLANRLLSRSDTTDYQLACAELRALLNGGRV